MNVYYCQRCKKLIPKETSSYHERGMCEKAEDKRKRKMREHLDKMKNFLEQK